MLAWHFLNNDGTLRKGGLKVTPGMTLRMRGKLVMCERGFHYSLRALDALQYAPGAMVSRVDVAGEIIPGTDKGVASQRTHLWIADATNTLHEFACWCAENALNLLRAKGQEPDPRAWAAIEAKRKWLRGEISDTELAAARGAAGAAARAAARDAQNAQLETMLLALEPVNS